MDNENKIILLISILNKIGANKGSVIFLKNKFHNFLMKYVKNEMNYIRDLVATDDFTPPRSMTIDHIENFLILNHAHIDISYFLNNIINQNKNENINESKSNIFPSYNFNYFNKDKGFELCTKLSLENIIIINVLYLFFKEEYNLTYDLRDFFNLDKDIDLKEMFNLIFEINEKSFLKYIEKVVYFEPDNNGTISIYFDLHSFNELNKEVYGSFSFGFTSFSGYLIIKEDKNNNEEEYRNKNKNKNRSFYYENKNNIYNYLSGQLNILKQLLNLFNNQ